MRGLRNGVALSLALPVMFASASAWAQSCPSGQESNNATFGHCCWPGQIWSNNRNRCVGDPTCPSGMTARGDECEAATAGAPVTSTQSPPAEPHVEPASASATATARSTPTADTSGPLAPMTPPPTRSMRVNPDDATQVGIIAAVRSEYSGLTGPIVLGTGGVCLIVGIIGWGAFAANGSDIDRRGAPSFVVGLTFTLAALVLLPIGGPMTFRRFRIEVDPVDRPNLASDRRIMPTALALRTERAAQADTPPSPTIASWSWEF